MYNDSWLAMAKTRNDYILKQVSISISGELYLSTKVLVASSSILYYFSSEAHVLKLSLTILAILTVSKVISIVVHFSANILNKLGGKYIGN